MKLSIGIVEIKLTNVFEKQQICVVMVVVFGRVWYKLLILGFSLTFECYC
jgi:hypothetical protein